MTGTCVVSDFVAGTSPLRGRRTTGTGVSRWLLRGSQSDPDTGSNVGGSAKNLTNKCATRGSPRRAVTAGQANVLPDTGSTLLQGKSLRRRGDWARSGQVLPDLLAAMLNGQLLPAHRPKSRPLNTSMSAGLHKLLGVWQSTSRGRCTKLTLVELQRRSIQARPQRQHGQRSKGAAIVRVVGRAQLRCYRALGLSSAGHGCFALPPLLLAFRTRTGFWRLSRA